MGKNSVKWYVECHGYLKNHQSYNGQLPIKSKKMSPLTVKNGIFKKFQKSSISYGTRFSQPKYHIPTWKTMTGSLKTKIY